MALPVRLMTEEEYRRHPGLNYSLLSALNSHPAKVHEQKVDGTEDHIVFGDAVDRLLFTPDTFDERYMVADVEKPTGKIPEIIELIFKDERCPTTLNDTDDWNRVAKLALEWADEIQYGGNWKADTIIRKIEEGGGWNYLEALNKSRGKIVIGKSKHGDIKTAVMTLTSHDFTAKYFQRMRGVERLYQFPIIIPQTVKTKFGKQEIELKGLLDILIINHKSKTVYPFDLKTLGKYVTNFPYEFTNWNYYLQAALYRYLVVKMVSMKYWQGEENPLYGYTVGPFKFIVISSLNSSYPAVFECSKNDITVGEYGGEFSSGRKVKGWRQLLMEYLWHRFYDKWDYPYEYYESQGNIVMDVFEKRKNGEPR